jgi:HTH-type transcriptional regulator/antitoxin HigA
MNTTETQFDIEAIQSSWQEFDALAHLRPIHSEADYVRMTALMNSLLEVVGDNEDHPMSGLLDLVSDIVASYEQEHYAIEPAAPKAR